MGVCSCFFIHDISPLPTSCTQQLQLMLFDTDGTGSLTEYQLEEYFRSLVPECPLLQEAEVGLRECECVCRQLRMPGLMDSSCACLPCVPAATRFRVVG